MNDPYARDLDPHTLRRIDEIVDGDRASAKKLKKAAKLFMAQINEISFETDLYITRGGDFDTLKEIVAAFAEADLAAYDERLERDLRERAWCGEEF